MIKNFISSQEYNICQCPPLAFNQVKIHNIVTNWGQPRKYLCIIAGGCKQLDYSICKEVDYICAKVVILK